MHGLRQEIYKIYKKKKERGREREKDVLQDNRPTQVGSKTANDRCLEAAQLKDQLR